MSWISGMRAGSSALHDWYCSVQNHYQAVEPQERFPYTVILVVEQVQACIRTDAGLFTCLFTFTRYLIAFDTG